MTTKRDRLWLTRDRAPSGNAAQIRLWRSIAAPFFDSHVGTYPAYRQPGNARRIQIMCVYEFRRITGVKLRPGQCAEVSRIAFTLKPPAKKRSRK